jgi:DNA-directed RNA polymerase subunit K/omega
MKKPSKLSRGPEINLEQCVANAGNNRFNLVLIASARAREIARKHREAGDISTANACVSAILDVQNKVVGKSYLYKD